MIRASFALMVRAGHNSLAVAIPQFVGLILVLVFGLAYGSGGTVAVGGATTIFGAAVLLSVGSAITSLRAVSKQIGVAGPESKRLPTFLPATLQQEFSLAWAFSAVGLIIAWCLVAITAIVSPDIAVAVGWYILGATPWIVVTPHTSVTIGTFQALDRDGFNARFAMVTGAAQILAGLGVLLLRLPLDQSMFMVGLSGGVVGFAALLYRLSVLSRMSQGRVSIYNPRRVANASREISLRLAAGADGVVYMTIFLLATTVAARTSVDSGAEVALAVSVMRLLIIPIKQLGLVGGRLLVQSGFRDTLTGLRTIRAAAFTACGFAALIVLVWGSIPSEMPFSLAIVLVAQLLLERLAGVQFAILKVAVGPAAGVRLLLACYWLIAPVALVLIGVLGSGESWSIWVILLAVRLGFAAGVHRITTRTILADVRPPAAAVKRA